MRLVLGCLLSLFASLAASQVSVTDDAGNVVRLAAPAKRIISLAPHATEILYAIGAGERIVGVVAHSDYPPEARRLPQVGGYNSVDLEAILALQPDLVVAWQSGNNALQLNKLRKLGLSVFVNEPRHLEDIPKIAVRLAELAGVRQQGVAFAGQFNRRLQDLRQRYAGRKPVRLFYEIWRQPLITINGKHLMSDVMRLCGARNVFADVPSLAPSVNVEAVLAAAPEIIVIGGMAEERQEWLDAWRRWREIPAVEGEQLYFINPDIMQRHGPRILEGAARLCQLVEQARQALGGKQ